MLSDLDAIAFALLDTKYSSIISCFCIPCRTACVASVSNRVIVRKLERGSFIFFFGSCPNYLDELARKRLLRKVRAELNDNWVIRTVDYE